MKIKSISLGHTATPVPTAKTTHFPSPCQEQLRQAGPYPDCLSTAATLNIAQQLDLGFYGMFPGPQILVEPPFLLPTVPVLSLQHDTEGEGRAPDQGMRGCLRVQSLVRNMGENCSNIISRTYSESLWQLCPKARWLCWVTVAAAPAAHEFGHKYHHQNRPRVTGSWRLPAA